MKRHLLVTNDFPPKVGGIQSYLWELWRRLDPSSYVVLTASSDAGAAAFDAAAGRARRAHRARARLHPLLPDAGRSGRRPRRRRRTHGADLVLLDPALPLGLLGPQLDVPYGVILHGAEVTVPGRLPGARAALARVLAGRALVVSAGGYPAAEARRAAPGITGTGGRDPAGRRRRPPSPRCKAAERRAARARLGLPVQGRSSPA